MIALTGKEVSLDRPRLDRPGECLRFSVAVEAKRLFPLLAAVVQYGGPALPSRPGSMAMMVMGVLPSAIRVSYAQLLGFRRINATRIERPR